MNTEEKRIKRNYRKLLEENFFSYKAKKEKLVNKVREIKKEMDDCDLQMDWCLEQRDKLLEK